MVRALRRLRRPRTARPRDRDGGFTLTEMLVVIVLMGVVVTAVTTSLQVSIKASNIDRHHAAAFAWLQAGSDEVFRVPRVPCTSDGQGRIDAIAVYDAAVGSAEVPPSWVDPSSPTGLLDGVSLRVVDVEYLGRVSIDDDFSWAPNWCFEGVGFEESPLYTQRVSIEVTLPGGTTVETLQMVKSE